MVSETKVIQPKKEDTRISKVCAFFYFCSSEKWCLKPRWVHIIEKMNLWLAPSTTPFLLAPLSPCNKQMSSLLNQSVNTLSLLASPTASPHGKHCTSQQPLVDEQYIWRKKKAIIVSLRPWQLSLESSSLTSSLILISPFCSISCENWTGAGCIEIWREQTSSRIMDTKINPTYCKLIELTPQIACAFVECFVCYKSQQMPQENITLGHPNFLQLLTSDSAFQRDFVKFLLEKIVEEYRIPKLCRQNLSPSNMDV